ncbi:TadE/TadG family type IV pilus assembly protein [Stakelama tenebrarum]|uniref:Pilus assembly protein n=1 Tax=Stakelama tenebrarum TaxID=2711215 RepID=A0A6G6Y5Q3_9SPHN|nr:TadE/TadG family type IV pilus assembly protein [Sphingosinithalassobacter tenebrarum]QIG79906.1 pilus assembly protein [Sphingosinithalassobacter tenebrarum]
MARFRFLPLLARLRRDSRGATLVEFAIVAPTLCLLLIGAFDVAHTLYMRSVLQGIIQKTARDSTLESSSESARQAVLDDAVRKQVLALANNATIDFKRRFYRTFTEAAAAAPEDWTDTNHNGRCDDGEPYEDENNNSLWDADGGNAGQGGAKDTTLYTVSVSYPQMFPLYRFVGGSDTITIEASTVLRNQPYADQESYSAPTVRNCP